MARPKRVLLATNYQSNDTTSLLRGWGPFSLLEKEGVCEIVQRPFNARDDWFVDWTNWARVDVCFIHRPSNPSFSHVIKYAKLHGIPVWIDHDDDLLNITPDNPVYMSHAGAGDDFKEAVEFSYREADVLTCSGTPMFRDFLEKDYGRTTDNTFLIDTGLDDRFVRLKQPFKKNNKVAWRGSKSHMIDLLFFAHGIEQSMIRRTEKDWFFWGINPFMFNFSGEKRIKWVEIMNLLPYLHAITYQNCSVHMVPLVDTKFNRVKSNLAWLDATLAGSVVVGPDFEHWDRPGVINYKSMDIEDFQKKLEQTFKILDEDPGILKAIHDSAWEYIQDNLMQSKLNGKRKEILRNL